MSHDTDKQIDFHKLERELDNAVEADAKYWRENDAKFRAVNQKVATYDEFRDIVLASHLKPLEKDDRLTDMKFTQPWNTQAGKTGPDTDTPTQLHRPQGESLPTTSQSFVREWRKLNNKQTAQYSYIMDIGGEKLESIFKTEIGFGLLGEFAKCLNCEYKSEDFNNCVSILDHLSKTNRFSLTLQFLSANERRNVVELFEKLNEIDKTQNTDGQETSVDTLVAVEHVYLGKK